MPPTRSRLLGAGRLSKLKRVVLVDLENVQPAIVYVPRPHEIVVGFLSAANKTVRRDRAHPKFHLCVVGSAAAAAAPRAAAAAATKDLADCAMTWWASRFFAQTCIPPDLAVVIVTKDNYYGVLRTLITAGLPSADVRRVTELEGI